MLIDDNTKPRVVVDLSQCEVLKCKNCGGEVFDVSFQIRKVPALLSPTAREELVGIQVFVCRRCGAVLREKGLEKIDEASDFAG